MPDGEMKMKYINSTPARKVVTLPHIPPKLVVRYWWDFLGLLAHRPSPCLIIASAAY